MSGRARSGCPGFEDLMALMDGELSESRRRELEEHLRRCSDCRRIIEVQRRMESSWRDAYESPPESRFGELRRNVLESGRSPARGRLLKFGLPIAAALIAALVGLRLFVPGVGGLLGTVDSPSASAARRAQEAMETRTETVVEGQVPQQEAEAGPEELSGAASEPAGTESGRTAEEAEETVAQQIEGGASSSSADDVSTDGREGSGYYAGRDDETQAEAEAPPREAAEEEADWDVQTGGGAMGYGAGAQSAESGEQQEPAASPEQSPDNGAAGGEGLESRGEAESVAVSDAVGLSVLQEAAADRDSAALDQCDTTREELAVSRSADVRSRLYLELDFDSAGAVSADRETMLDSLAPFWRDSLRGRHADTALVITLQELLEILASE